MTLLMPYPCFHTKMKIYRRLLVRVSVMEQRWERSQVLSCFTCCDILTLNFGVEIRVLYW